MANNNEINFSLYKLASDLDKFSKDNDTYEYMDVVEDTAGHIQSIYDALSAGQTKEFKDHIKEFIHESMDECAVSEAKDLLNRMADLPALDEDKLICFGCHDNSFYAIQQHDSFYSLWVVDDTPKDMSPNGVKTFMLEHQNEGSSTAGNWDQIKMEFHETFSNLSIPQEFQALSPVIPEHCFWFALTDEKCISVWYAPDKHDGDQFQMHLELRGEDGSMGPGCEVLSDESYATADLSAAALSCTLREICSDAGLSIRQANAIVPRLTEAILDTYKLKKPSLDNIISSASQKAPPAKDTKERSFEPEH